METIIRDAAAVDLKRINEIYNEYIADRHTSFDEGPWTIAERQAWFRKCNDALGRYRVLVLEAAGRVVGFASSSPFRRKAAYASSVETTVVLGGEALGHGLGGSLLGALLDPLGTVPVHRAYALIALPNDPSIVLHRRFGYREVGVMEEVGFKLGEYHSVLMMERAF
jgi:phosphinothricin acetyltransferase